ncbi:MAG TPA: hypothetical protein VJ063_10585 [Verrucomicrobiae bacterium]|nr:hypothetical protein [Verrucomicrobiae bacterium]
MKYRWRELTLKEQADLLAWRRSRGHPWHSPQHREGTNGQYHITAACYEHQAYIGYSTERLRSFCDQLMCAINESSGSIHGWCVLPNHYHAIIETADLPLTLSALGKLHGRTSFTWNKEEKAQGRKVWYRCVERSMRNERHRWATLNYIHNNAVHHGYVPRWQDWPFSSAAEYLDRIGADKAREIWHKYPVLDYGKGWDDPDL